MKKFLLFMLLFVNLQIVVTKCGVEIGIQSAKAQDAGKEADYYKCEDDLGKGYPEVYYSPIPCEKVVITPYQCKYCGCKNLEANQIASHEAACSKKSNNSNDDDDLLLDIMNILSEFGYAANGVVDNYNIGQLNKDGSYKLYDADKGFKGNQYVTMLTDVQGGLKNTLKYLGWLSSGVYIGVSTYNGINKDIIEKNGIPWHTIDGLASSAVGCALGDVGASLGAAVGTSAGPGGAAIFGLLGGAAGCNIGEDKMHKLIDEIKSKVEGDKYVY